jgi:DNA-binding MarR family transcriptional regulator
VQAGLRVKAKVPGCAARTCHALPVDRQEGLRLLDSCMLRMRRAQNSQSAAAQHASRVSGVSLSPLSLAILYSLDRDGPARVKALVERVGSELTQVSREVSVLTASGHVTRSPYPSDGRAVVVALTEFGAGQWAAYRDAALAMVADVVAEWSDEQVVTFARLFDSFLHGMPAGGDSRLAAQGTV